MEMTYVYASGGGLPQPIAVPSLGKVKVASVIQDSLGCDPLTILVGAAVGSRRIDPRFTQEILPVLRAIAVTGFGGIAMTLLLAVTSASPESPWFPIDYMSILFGFKLVILVRCSASSITLLGVRYQFSPTAAGMPEVEFKQRLLTGTI